MTIEKKSETPKVSILAAVWKRPEIFTIFCEAIKSLNGNISVMIAGSPKDECEAIAKKYGFDYVSSPNENLAGKLNKAAVELKEKHNPDKVLMLGSDDILNQNLFDWYLSRKEDYLYLKDFYFYDTRTKRSIYWGGYDKDINRGHACGAGRCLSSDLMEQLEWQPWALGMDKILDSAMNKKLSYSTYSSYGIFLRNSPGLIGVDIKSSTNMTPFALWPNSQYIDSKNLLNNFDERIKQKILQR